MTLEEILAIEDISEKIALLKKGRRTEQPNVAALWDKWNPSRHAIIWNKEKYPDRKVLVREEHEEYDTATGRTIRHDARYKDEEINRIAIPLEQDIVNIHTAFTVGTEPRIICTTETEEEEKMLKAVKRTMKANKIKFRNKKIVRSWLSEQEAAEYWYAADDDSFWAKFWRSVKSAFGGKTKPSKRLKSVVWSPFRGDVLYPYFDEQGDMVAFSREYKQKTENGEETFFHTITDKWVYTWNETLGVEVNSFAHGFSKIPVIYLYRPEAYCDKIETERERLEKLLSSYADCIDYHFFPLLKLIGDVAGFSGKTKDRIVKLENGADAQYLTWSQVPDTVKFEAENLTNMAYDMTNTPRISFESMRGVGKLSGVAFRCVFMGAHMAVSNHAEEVEEFLQRRVNFIVSALGTINVTELGGAAETIDIETEVTPYMIDDTADDVATAVAAVSGGVWSRREGIIFAGNADRVEEELREIKDDIKKTENNKT